MLAHAGVASRRRNIELRRRTITVGVPLPFTGGLEVEHALKERRVSRNRDAFSIFCSDHRPFALDDSPRYRVIPCVTFLLCLVSLDQYNIAFSEADGLTYRLFGHAA